MSKDLSAAQRFERETIIEEFRNECLNETIKLINIIATALNSISGFEVNLVKIAKPTTAKTALAIIPKKRSMTTEAVISSSCPSTLLV